MGLRPDHEGSYSDHTPIVPAYLLIASIFILKCPDLDDMVTLSYGNPTCKTKEFQFYRGSNEEPERVLSRALTGWREREGETKFKLTGNNVKNGLGGGKSEERQTS